MRLRVQLWKLLRLMLRLNIGIEIVSLMPEKYMIMLEHYIINKKNMSNNVKILDNLLRLRKVRGVVTPVTNSRRNIHSERERWHIALGEAPWIQWGTRWLMCNCGPGMGHDIGARLRCRELVRMIRISGHLSENTWGIKFKNFKASHKMIQHGYMSGYLNIGRPNTG